MSPESCSISEVSGAPTPRISGIFGLMRFCYFYRKLWLVGVKSFRIIPSSKEASRSLRFRAFEFSEASSSETGVLGPKGRF